MTHTPGPWSDNKWNCDEHQISALGSTVALVGHDSSVISEESADANGRLIASAPELLYQLKCIEANLTGADYFPDRVADPLRRAKEAIAVADGRSPLGAFYA